MSLRFMNLNELNFMFPITTFEEVAHGFLITIAQQLTSLPTFISQLPLSLCAFKVRMLLLITIFNFQPLFDFNSKYQCTRILF
jgi:hypothetical protein